MSNLSQSYFNNIMLMEFEIYNTAIDTDIIIQGVSDQLYIISMQFYENEVYRIEKNIFEKTYIKMIKDK